MTLIRTGTIALAVGAVVAAVSGGGLRRWPVAALLVLWPALGGHFVEVFFLNWIRPVLPPLRWLLVLARLATWFVGGCLLAVGMYLTGIAVHGFHSARWLPWWVGGAAFIGIELMAHLIMQFRGRNNFFNGRG